MPDTWGFIDGTVRPLRGDEALARGLQRPQAHPLAEISVCHDSRRIIAHLMWPWVGRRHDSKMLGESGLYEGLEAYANGVLSS